MQQGELPELWGLLAARGGRLVSKVEAKRLHDESPLMSDWPLPPAFSRSSLAALLRAAQRLDNTEEREAARAEGRRAVEEEIEALRAKVAELQRREELFAREAGVPLSRWWGDARLEKVAAAVRLVLDGEDTATALRSQLEGVCRAGAGAGQGR